MRHKGIKRLSRGKYEVRVTATDPRTGKRKEVRRIVEGTVDDALDTRQELRDRLLLQRPKDGRMRLVTYARLWLNARLDVLELSTAKKYANDLEGHIVPALGDYFVDALRPSDVQRFISEQAAQFAGRSVMNRLRLLRTIAKDAVAEGLTDVEFTARVRPPTVRAFGVDDPNLLSADEMSAVLRVIPEQWRTLVLVMVTTGLRWGEATGLKWSDIDFDALVVHVRRTNWKGQLQAPKTRRSKRDPALAKEVADSLREHRRRLVAQHPGLTAGWVFPTADDGLHRGTPLGPVIERALEAVGIKKRVTPHGLRRTFNDLARRVTSREVVKAITGHATDAMVEHYSVVTPAEKQEAAAGVLRLLKLHQSGS